MPDVVPRVDRGTLTLVGATGALLVARAAVRLGDGRLISTESDGVVATREGSRRSIVRPGSDEAPEVSWLVDRVDEAAFELHVEVRNTTAATLAVEQLLPLVAPSGYASLPLGALRIGQVGWGSWSRAHPPRPFYANAASAPPPIRSPLLPHRAPGGEVMAWMALLGGEGDACCLVGFTAGREQTGAVEVVPRGAGHTLLASAEVEGLPLEPGHALGSEPLLVAFGAEQALLDRYAGAVAGQMQARRPHQVPTGWCSWYQFFTDVTEADVRRNLAVLADLRSKLPIQLVQLDDGFQEEVGDWLSLKATFSSGMPALTAAIRAHGFTPGIWLAPFLLSARSKTYAEHPDWVVRGDDGAPVCAIDNWGCANYALDTTHPAAMAWLEDMLRTVCEDWGYDYLKVDFVYAASLRGRRYEPVTGAQAYRRGMQLVRRVAGERFVLGCGAPFVASVGLVDGMRIGSDVAPYWHPPGGRTVGPATVNALRTTLAHGWMHGRWWANDPDCVLARDADSDLTPAEVRAWASVVALSGGMVLIGDDLSRIGSDQRALLARLLPPYGVAADVFPPLVDDIPEHIRLRVERPWGDCLIVGLANWSEEPRPVRFDPAEWSIPWDAFHVVDQWSGAHQGPIQGSLALGVLEPHSLRLLVIYPHLGRPQVVGSTGHLLGDAMDVEATAWDGECLQIALAGSRPHRGELLICVPGGYRLASAHGDAAGGRLVGELLRLPFDLERPRVVDLSFTRVGP